MFLFIFESIGTSELILVGIVALIFLGPRRLPEIARKIGKITAEFRGTANEFKETWKREVDFEEESKAFDLNRIEQETDERDPGLVERRAHEAVEQPAVKEVDPALFDDLPDSDSETSALRRRTSNEKKNWL